MRRPGESTKLRQRLSIELEAFRKQHPRCWRIWMVAA
jgi:hypothetical protein